MKKIKLLFMAILAGAMLFTGCSEDDETFLAPTLTLTPTQTSYEIDFQALTTPTTTISFAAAIQADAGIKFFTLEQTKINGVEEETTTINVGVAWQGQKSYTYNFSMNFTNEDFIDATSYEYTFIVTDAQDQVTDQVVTITVKDYAAPSFNFGNQAKVIAHNFNIQPALNVAFTLGIAAASKIGNFTIVKSEVSDSGTRENENITVTPGFAGLTAYDYNVDVDLIESEFVGLNRIELIFTVTDFSGKQELDTIKITRIYQFTTTNQGEIFHFYSPEKAAWDLDNDLARSSAESGTLKSMINTDANNPSGSASNFTGSWKSTSPDGNGTQFVKANTYDYVTALVSEAMTAFAGGTASTVVTNPAIDDIYIAKNGTTYYVIKIKTLDQTSGTDNDGDLGKLTFEYKKY